MQMYATWLSTQAPDLCPRDDQSQLSPKFIITVEYVNEQWHLNLHEHTQVLLSLAKGKGDEVSAKKFLWLKSYR